LETPAIKISILEQNWKEDLKYEGTKSSKSQWDSKEGEVPYVSSSGHFDETE